MARTGRNEYIRNEYRRTEDRRNMYVYDNLARSQEFVRTLEEEPRRSISNEARKNREKAHHMNLAYVMFLIAALCCTGVVLVNYLQIQSEVTRKAEVIASMEKDLNDLHLSNEEEYNRILSNINMEEIKRVAIGELGMTYAREGQIETYASVGNDYMRRVAQD